MLHHVSETPGIARFDPRPSTTADRPVVWAVDADHLRNYLLPRDCPRVTFYAGPRTTPADRDRLLGGSDAVVAFESAWLDAVRRARLYCYQLPDDGFTCVDANAGYLQSVAPVVPLGVDIVGDCLAALVARGVEVRIVPSLWPLRNAVVASTVSYSIIRMRNAGPLV